MWLRPIPGEVVQVASMCIQKAAYKLRSEFEN
jgi:hypothetical protein